jgi:hypothetical protein
MKSLKTLEERKQEIALMKSKLMDLGLSTEYEGIKEFYKDLDAFELGFSGSGQIKLKGLKRIIIFKLSCNPKIESSLLLKYDEHV